MRIAYGRLGAVMLEIFIWVALVLIVRHLTKH